MPLDISSQSFSCYEFFRERAREKENQVLDRKTRIELGRYSATFKEKFIRFFLDCFTFFRQGWTRAVEEHENYFNGKSVQIIRLININLLKKTLNKKVEPDAINEYLSHLEEGKVLFPHFDLNAIVSCYQAYQLAAEAKQDKNHWLKAFANENGLGKDLEHLHALPLEIKDRLLKLDALQKKALSPAFALILKDILGNEKLENLSEKHIQEMRTYLTLSRLFERKGIEGRQDAQQSFQLLKTIETDKGEAVAQNFKTFFIGSPPVVQNLFLRFSQDLTDLLEAKDLIEKLNSSQISLPVDLYFSLSSQEMIQKLKEELPENAHATRVKRFGESFANFYEKSKFSSNTLPDSVKKLYQIEANFRLCGESERFKKMLTSHFEAGLFKKSAFSNLTNFNSCLETMQKATVGNESGYSALYSLEQLADLVRQYMALEVRPTDIQAFLAVKHNAIKFTSLLALETSKESMTKTIHDARSKFNQNQYHEVKETWSTYFGANHFAHESERIAKSSYQNINGAQHYRSDSTFIHRQLQLEKMFLHFNLEDLAKEYGEAFLSYAVDYLFYASEQRKTAADQAKTEAEKNRIQDPHRLKQDWKALLQSLKKLKEELSAEGINADLFNHSWQAYIKPFDDRHPDKLIILDRANGFALNAIAIKEFKETIELRKTKESLHSLENTHGPLFSESLQEYLKATESDIMKGIKPLSEAKFFKIPKELEEKDLETIFKHQLAPLKAYFAAQLNLQAVSDRAIDFLCESPDAETFKVRANNLAQLEELFGEEELERKEYKKEENKKLAQACLHLFISETKLLDEPSSDIFSQNAKDAFKNIRAVVGFCQKDAERQKAYSPEVLAETFFSLAKDGEKDTPLLARLEHVAQTTKQAVFNQLCFDSHVRKLGEQEIKDKNQGNQIRSLVNQLLANFHKKEVIPIQIGLVNDLVKLVVSLSSLTNNNLEMIKKVLSEQKIPLDIQQINQIRNMNFNEIQKRVTEEIKTRVEQKEESDRWLNQIRDNPFSLVHSFVPRLIAKLAYPEVQAGQKTTQKELSSTLKPLEAYFNGSSWIAQGKGLLAPLLELLLKNQRGINEAKKLISEQAQTFTGLDTTPFVATDDNAPIRTKENQLRREMQKSILGTIAWDITNKIIEAISDIDEAHRNTITTSVQARAGNEKTETDKGASSFFGSAIKYCNMFIDLTTLISKKESSFFYDILPLLVKYKDDPWITTTIGNWIEGLRNTDTSLIDKMLPSLIQAGLKKAVDELLFKESAEKKKDIEKEELDGETKNRIAEILTDKTIAQNLLLALPTFAKKHSIGVYLNYLTELNKILQSNQPPTEREIYQFKINTVKLLQQVMKELPQYGALLEESFREIPG